MDGVIHLNDVVPEVKGRVQILGGGLARLLSFSVRKNGSSDVYHQIVVMGVGDEVYIPFDPTSYSGSLTIPEYFERLRDEPTREIIYRIKDEVDSLQDEGFYEF